MKKRNSETFHYITMTAIAMLIWGALQIDLRVIAILLLIPFFNEARLAWEDINHIEHGEQVKKLKRLQKKLEDKSKK